jgi:Kef-type K+ transport system membrane component KefB
MAVTETAGSIQFLVLLFGGILVLNMFLRMGMKKIGSPSLIGFIALGFLFRLGDSQMHFFSTEANQILKFLADIGLITLLFRVGLESNLKGLLKQARHASLIWTGDIMFSGLLGFTVSYWLLGLELVTCLFVAVALTATSVSVSVSVWQEENVIQSPVGELLIDVAEMDDVSGIILMTLLLSAVSGMSGSIEAFVIGDLAKILGLILLKLLLFGALCVIFSLLIEKRLLRFFSKRTHSPQPMLVVAGFGFVIAGIGVLLGFSLAIGAFFAGLVFSRDHESVKWDASFSALYEIFAPFFFIGIGLGINPMSLTKAAGLGSILLVLAVLGKLIGDGSLSLVVTDPISSALISVSMIPRAEIAMVIMQRGHQLGEWAVPEAVFSAMVLVTLGTCVISPIVLRKLLKRWPQGPEQS